MLNKGKYSAIPGSCQMLNKYPASWHSCCIISNRKNEENYGHIDGVGKTFSICNNQDVSTNKNVAEPERFTPDELSITAAERALKPRRQKCKKGGVIKQVIFK